MKIQILKCTFTTLLIFVSFSIFAQHTFSIVAVDPETGEVGSAGATCLTSADCNGCGGAVIISALFPGLGAINSQASVCIPNVNGNNAMNQMITNDLSASQTLAWVLLNDACQFGGPDSRQYGIARLDDNGMAQTASHTGSSTLAYAGHITGPNYSIQGNILIGAEVLEGMEQGFLNTQGTLAEKLMAAMQGANIPGADSRCLPDGISSKSAFLRLAKPDDPVSDLSLDLNVPDTDNLAEPIDSLQTLFDQNFISTYTEELKETALSIFPNPASEEINIVLDEVTLNGETTLELYNEMGMKLKSLALQSRFNKFSLIDIKEQSGLLIYKLISDQRLIGTGKLIIQK